MTDDVKALMTMIEIMYGNAEVPTYQTIQKLEAVAIHLNARLEQLREEAAREGKAA